MSSPSSRTILLASAVGLGVSVVSHLAFSRIRRRTRESSLDDDESAKERKAQQQEEGTDETTNIMALTPEATLSLIKKRRSIFPKQYTTKPVPRHVIEHMLEGARWAPTHHLTEPWHFIIFESQESKSKLGNFLAEHYKKSTTSSGKQFLQKKYDKKLKNAIASSYVIAICVTITDRNPLLEEICTVATCVQNMHLVATSYGVGAYWSTSGIYATPPPKTEEESGGAAGGGGGDSSSSLLVNPEPLREFLNLDTAAATATTADDVGSSKETGGGISRLCLGWMYVGDFLGDNDDGNSGKKKKKWPQGRRQLMEEGSKVSWR